MDTVFHLEYCAPYGFERLLEFYRVRQLAGVELVEDGVYLRTARVFDAAGEEHVGWVRVENDPAHEQLTVQVSASLVPVATLLKERLRVQFDVDCNPEVVCAGLAALEEAVPGTVLPETRLPGAFDGFETTVRAVLGQQISVKAANKLAERIVNEYGASVETEIEGLNRLFPTPEDFLAMENIEESLGVLGVVSARSRTIRALSEGVVSGELQLNPQADALEQMDRLLAVKGIGPWSANYIAMRVLNHTDAFLEKDAGIKHALPELDPKQRLELVEPCRPWRSYANISLWNSLG